jgi:hypothetical protein
MEEREGKGKSVKMKKKRQTLQSGHPDVKLSTCASMAVDILQQLSPSYHVHGPISASLTHVNAPANDTISESNARHRHVESTRRRSMLPTNRVTRRLLLAWF